MKILKQCHHSASLIRFCLTHCCVKDNAPKTEAKTRLASMLCKELSLRHKPPCLYDDDTYRGIARLGVLLIHIKVMRRPRSKNMADNVAEMRVSRRWPVCQ